MKRKIYLLFVCICITLCGFAQTDNYILLKPDRVFDGENMHTGWVVLIKNDSIAAAGPMQFKLPAGTQIIELKNTTLLPGLIEGHAHILLHPYNEIPWDDQVLKESRAERTARAVNHAKATLMAGFTTIRDLGTEGAMYDDAGLKTAIEKGIIPGPRMIIATRAIVAKGTYGPNAENADGENIIGAEEVTGLESMANAVRTQIGKGADLIKIYADYRYGLNKEAVPTFTEAEICEICLSGKRDKTLLCVVETPGDLLMMEQTQTYRGLYFVLMGRLSPLDGIGPKDIHLDSLIKRASDGIVKEVILATNFTVEGEATAHYISELLGEKGLKVSRIARGLPVGGELEYVDAGTLAQAFIERRAV